MSHYYSDMSSIAQVTHTLLVASRTVLQLLRALRRLLFDDVCKTAPSSSSTNRSSGSISSTSAVRWPTQHHACSNSSERLLSPRPLQSGILHDSVSGTSSLIVVYLSRERIYMYCSSDAIPELCCHTHTSHGLKLINLV